MSLRDKAEIDEILKVYNRLKTEPPCAITAPTPVTAPVTLNGKSTTDKLRSGAAGSGLPILTHNAVLYDIFEGNLLPYVLQELQAQFNAKTFPEVASRVAPINVLRKLISKLSGIYSTPPSREIKDGSESDKELMSWYVEQLDPNTNGGVANEFFNLFKYCSIEPYVEDGKPKLRVIPANKFFVLSLNRSTPTSPTHYVKIMGECEMDGGRHDILHVYTKDEFRIINDQGETMQSEMDALENSEGVNIYGAIPAVYMNRSKTDLMPKPDTDTLSMTKLIPILLSDLNYAVKYQCFSVMYAIDVDMENVAMAPNALWELKSKAGSMGTETNPQVGSVKPQVDTMQVIDLIRAELSLWMQTRNIKPGTVGKVSPENAISGISKMVDEMDTSEDRQKQVPYFVDGEKKLFDLIFNHMHPVWVKTEQEYEQKRLFSKRVETVISFDDQEPNFDPASTTDVQIKQLDGGLTTQERAVQACNPDMSPEDVKKLCAEIKKEKADNAPDLDEPNDMPNDKMPMDPKSKNAMMEAAAK